MAKLPRVLQKIFGSTGGSSNFGQIGSKAAGAPTTTKDVDTIQALSEYDTGLTAIVAGGDSLPRLEDINSMYYMLTSQLKYLYQAGISEWIATEDYYSKTSVVIGSDGVIYMAVADTTGNDPTTDTTGTNWIPINKPLELANNDISAGNGVTNLSTYETSFPIGGKIKISWTGGDGTYTHTFSGGAYTIGGRTAGDWIGEGDGSLILEKGASDWKIVSPDLWDKITSGTTPGNGRIQKLIDGNGLYKGYDFLLGNSSSAAQKTLTLPFTPLSINYVDGDKIGIKDSSDPTTIDDFSADSSLTGSVYYLSSTLSMSIAKVDGNLSGATRRYGATIFVDYRW